MVITIIFLYSEIQKFKLKPHQKININGKKLVSGKKCTHGSPFNCSVLSIKKTPLGERLRSSRFKILKGLGFPKIKK